MILFLGKFIMMYNRLQSYILVTGGTGVMVGNPDVSEEWKSVTTESDTRSAGFCQVS